MKKQLITSLLFCTLKFDKKVQKNIKNVLTKT